MPGSSEDIIKRIESISKRKLNEGFGFVYVPDLVALGSVIHDFENPDLLMVGESDPRYGEIAESLYRKIIKNNAPSVRMSLAECEVAKISLNAYVTMKISFANFIGNVAQKLNCNPSNITRAIGLDRRISPHYIKSGLPFGGTCFPRDTWAFMKMSEDLGLNASHIKASQEINERQHEILYDQVSAYRDKKIGIMGLSFKPGTEVTSESSGYILYNKLKKLKYKVRAFDPLVKADYTGLPQLENFVKSSEVIVLTHNNQKILEKICLDGIIVINPWDLKV
jgi:UDPglucose 6-dehydrogenase